MELELETNGTYYKSYTDDIHYGNFFRGRREYVGSIVSGSDEYRKAQIAYDFYYKKLNSKFRSGTNRFLSLNQINSYYADSLMPEFTDIYKQNGGKFVRAYVDELVATGLGVPYLEIPFKLLLGAYFPGTNSFGYGIYNVQATNGTFLADTKWQNQHPFEIQFNNIPKVEKFKTENMSCLYTETAVVMSGGTGVEYVANSALYSNRYRLAFYQGSNTIEPGSADYRNYLIYPTTDATGSYTVSDTFTNTNLRYTSDTEIRIGFYGIDLYETSIISPATAVNYSYFPTFALRNRGWKYGIYNGFPTSPKSIFRRNKYGMLSHKLESRLFSIIFDKNTNTFIRPIGEILFESGSSDYVTASNQSLNTYDSGIYNVFYKSGKPFQEI